MNDRITYNQIDLYRALAVLWIVIAHISFSFNADYRTGVNWIIYLLQNNLAFPVAIFFLSSGYLITSTALKYDKFEIGQFFQKKVLRIIPGYLFVILLAIAIYAIIPQYSVTVKRILPIPDTYEISGVYANGILLKNTNNEDIFLKNESLIKNAEEETSVYSETMINSHNSKGSYLPYLSFTQNIFPENRIPSLYHLWFISVLLHCYILLGVILYLSFKSGQKRKRSIYILLFSVTIFMVSHLVSETSMVTYETFFFGATLAAAAGLIRKPENKRFYAVLFVICFITGAGLIALLIYFTPDKAAFFVPLNYMAASFIIFNTFPPRINQALTIPLKPLFWIGRHSYGIYLIHYPLVSVYVIGRNYIKLNSITHILVFLVLSIIIGASFDLLVNKIYSKLSKR
ncbi:acyltransferase family protein [Nitrospirota bacterium]